eukprot:GHRQ01027387.1.p1 GENE.GHRQ01027387.1~~GHRQ01027387.1.p1  ORF type:complete len:170 (+),score=26.50 GHRQ01027387.1:125-634(+)
MHPFVHLTDGMHVTAAWCGCRAFLDPYAQFSRFSDGAGGLDLEEFLDAKDVVTSLSREYEACERADYVSGHIVCFQTEPARHAASSLTCAAGQCVVVQGCSVPANHQQLVVRVTLLASICMLPGTMMLTALMWDLSSVTADCVQQSCMWSGMAHAFVCVLLCLQIQSEF